MERIIDIRNLPYKHILTHYIELISNLYNAYFVRMTHQQ